MKNRLQFRYCEKIFNSKEEIKNHLVGLFNRESSPLKPALAGEPLVFYYKEDGDTDVNAVLAIGRPTVDDEYFLIDVTEILKRVVVLENKSDELSELPDKLDQEIQDRISGDTRLEELIEENKDYFDAIIKRICESAGFNNDGEDIGSYDDIAHDSSHYIDSATSLANADLLLDEAIWQNHVEIVHFLDSARTEFAVTVEHGVSARSVVSYNILQGGHVVGEITIPTDRSISGGNLHRNDQGKWVITFYVINENDAVIETFDVDVEGLEDIYEGGVGITVSGNVISVNFKEELDETIEGINNRIDILSGEVDTLKEDIADIIGDVSGLSSTVTDEDNGVSVTVEQVGGRLHSIDVVAPDVDAKIAVAAAETLSGANAYTDSKAADVLEQAKDYTDNNVTSIYKVKGSKTYYEELAQIEDPKVGDVYNVVNEYRYSGNTGEMIIYPAGTNYVYVKDAYAAVGRWDPLGGQTYDMSLYLSKEEFAEYTLDISNFSAFTVNELERIEGKVDAFSSSTVNEFVRVDNKIESALTIVNNEISELSANTENKISELSAGTVAEIENLTNEVLDNEYVTARALNDINNRISNVITSLDDLDNVVSAGTYYIDAFVVKEMKQQLEELIANSVNERMVKNIVASMLVGKAEEIGLELADANGNPTAQIASAETITIGFADDAKFEATLPE